MSDLGDLGEMEARIKAIFEKAGKEIKAKWDEWLKGMDADLDMLQKAYEAAKNSGDGAAIRKAGIALSKAKRDKITGNKYYEKMIQQATERLNDANVQAMAYINGKMPKVYASSFNGSDKQIAKDLPYNIGVSFDLVDESTVARLMRDPNLDLSDLVRGIDREKMAAWNSKAIVSQITQGIVSGDSIPRIAGRIMDVAGMDEKAAIRTARTMTTGAENAGREDSYLRAQDMGIALRQQWVAALDGRTRHSHRVLDGEVQEVNKPFSNGLRFPGDPNGPPAEICNCRCTLIAKLEGFDREKIERWNKLDGMTYEDWKYGEAEHMSANRESSWPPGDGGLTAKELEDLSKYAEEKGIHFDVNSFKRFEGSYQTVSDIIDSISKVGKDFPLISKQRGGLTLRNSYSMDDRDYAETRGKNIFINNNAFRNAKALAEDYLKQVEDGLFIKGTTYKSIGFHEAGHAVIEAYKIPLSVADGVDCSELSLYSLQSSKEAIAESFCAVYTGCKYDSALQIFKKCVKIISGKR